MTEETKIHDLKLFRQMYETERRNRQETEEKLIRAEDALRDMLGNRDVIIDTVEREVIPFITPYIRRDYSPFDMNPFNRKIWFEFERKVRARFEEAFKLKEEHRAAKIHIDELNHRLTKMSKELSALRTQNQKLNDENQELNYQIQGAFLENI